MVSYENRSGGFIPQLCFVFVGVTSQSPVIPPPSPMVPPPPREESYFFTSLFNPPWEERGI